MILGSSDCRTNRVLTECEGPVSCQHICLGWPQAEEQTVLLKAGETARVALQLTPLRAGPLAVTGLEWVLNGHAPGYKLFAERRAPARRAASRCAAPLIWRAVPW